jgi:hypothetical protein
MVLLHSASKQGLLLQNTTESSALNPVFWPAKNLHPREGYF